jgi:hypothetical protein
VSNDGTATGVGDTGAAESGANTAALGNAAAVFGNAAAPDEPVTGDDTNNPAIMANDATPDHTPRRTTHP